MRRRTALILAAPVAIALLVPAAAFAKDASDSGEGLAGETSDKFVTLFSLGVVVFFFLVIASFSAIQSRLEKRKQQKKAAQSLQELGW